MGFPPSCSPRRRRASTWPETASRGGAVAAQAEREQARDALLTLERTGLLAIDRAGTPPTVRMSAVIQAAVRAGMPDGMLDRTARAAADALLEVWPRDDLQPWLAEDLRSCAVSLEQAGGDLLWAGGCHPLLMRAGRSLVSARLTGPAIAYWAKLAAAGDRVLGRAHPDTLVAIQQLADAYLAAGRGRSPFRGFSGFSLTGPARWGRIIPAPSRPGVISGVPRRRRASLATRSRSWAERSVTMSVSTGLTISRRSAHGTNSPPRITRRGSSVTLSGWAGAPWPTVSAFRGPSILTR